MRLRNRLGGEPRPIPNKGDCLVAFAAIIRSIAGFHIQIFHLGIPVALLVSFVQIFVGHQRTMTQFELHSIA
jgi:hypothetical protein